MNTEPMGNRRTDRIGLRRRGAGGCAAQAGAGAGAGASGLRLGLALALALGVNALLLEAAHAATPGPDVRRDATVEAVARAMPSVVNIATETIVEVRDPFADLLQEFWGPYYRRRPRNAQYSLGSGVVIDEDGYVLTNDHVVRRASRIWVKFADEAGGAEYEAERVAGTSASDVALLRLLPVEGQKLPKFRAVSFANDDDLMLGETVIALGNPFGLGGSVSKGILSSKSRRPFVEGQPLDIADWLQTDAAINPGNSGGPLINLRGELIGLSVAVYREGQGIGFAIPVKRVAEALSQIFSPEAAKLWFGARVRAGTKPLTVLTVQPGSPAEKAGLRVGDVIAGINGKPPASFIEFNQALFAAGDKREVRLEVQRGAEQQTLRLRLVPEARFFNAALVQQKLGLSVQEITNELAERLGLITNEGLLVAGVDRDGPAAKSGLQRGHILLTLDGRWPEDLIEAAKLLHGKKPGEKVAVGVLATRQRGAFLYPQRGTVELTVR